MLTFIFLLFSVFLIYFDVLCYYCHRHNGSIQLFHVLGRLYSEQDFHRCQRSFMSPTLSHIRPDLLWTKYIRLFKTLFHLLSLIHIFQEKLILRCCRLVLSRYILHI